MWSVKGNRLRLGRRIVIKEQTAHDGPSELIVDANLSVTADLPDSEKLGGGDDISEEMPSAAIIERKISLVRICRRKEKERKHQKKAGQSRKIVQ